MNRKESRTQFVSVRLTPQEKETLKKLAKSDQLLPSEYFRHLLHDDANRRIGELINEGIFGG